MLLAPVVVTPALVNNGRAVVDRTMAGRELIYQHSKLKRGSLCEIREACSHNSVVFNHFCLSFIICPFCKNYMYFLVSTDNLPFTYNTYLPILPCHVCLIWETNGYACSEKLYTNNISIKISAYIAFWLLVWVWSIISVLIFWLPWQCKH